MSKRDNVLIALVLGAVVAVAALRSGRARPTGLPAPGGLGQSVASSPQVTTRMPRMVDIGAGRCIPCKKMAPILTELRGEYAGRAEIVFIDVWERPELAEGYTFELIPTQIFYDRQGREVWRHEGFLDKPEIVAQFRRMGVE